MTNQNTNDSRYEKLLSNSAYRTNADKFMANYMRDISLTLALMYDLAKSKKEKPYD